MALESFISYAFGGKSIKANQVRDAIAVVLLVGLGIRISEVVAVRHSNILGLFVYRPLLWNFVLILFWNLVSQFHLYI